MRRARAGLTENEKQFMKVLEGIKVLDFGRFIAGPYCAALLADYGADVIRIDRVEGGEDRYIVPVTEGGEGAMFLQLNRNKRSMTLDLDSPQGREIVRKLVAGADVVIANMPPRTLKSLGLDYATLSGINPGIILVASNAFGDAEAVRDRVGFDGVGQALSGAVYMAGTPDQPQKAMVPVVDFATSFACALGTMLALYERKRSGKGQEVSASLLCTGLNMASGALIEEALLGLDRQATLNRASGYAPSDIFKARDGWFITQVIGQAMFKRWTRLVERPELFEDARFADDRLRGEHGEVLSAIMSDWCGDKTLDEALAQLEKARIPAGRVNSPRQALEDETVRAANLIQWMDYPGAPGKVPIFSTPVSLSRTPPEIHRRAPLNGEHTEAILADLGVDARAIADLRQRRVI
ncbi:CoA-transferase family III protein [Bordetella bronchiseptica CA90 BB1334]|nr:CoA-transferase family III protein [Bordetella bronchiseptica OSU054]KAK77613.1 CoA-transferase family III protein [Bordetella bronchiseptica CA90 BB02]KDB76866.1 CoA-transferase family III protein [Bordetella bronchiseptica CA90 BB1334]KDC22363.1 CoA-transferase family III protein [Bordetella bronchiseptica F-1]KDC26497.1 CoA-transferase family III protein [Bordetella bronchiseptica F2]KDC29840.1 CoA-transferase family III protein [Bordetella bronchiseptica F4563]KDD44133.1 CoA-transferas